jgi:hypothetical protein
MDLQHSGKKVLQGADVITFYGTFFDVSKISKHHTGRYIRYGKNSLAPSVCHIAEHLFC